MDSFVDDLLIKAAELCERLSKQADTTEAFIKTIRKTSHWKNPNLYKTTICDHWRSKRKCKYGPKCWYAHGSQELRSNGGQLSEAFNGLSVAPSSQDSQQNGLSNGLSFQQQQPFDVLDSLKLGYMGNGVNNGGQDHLRTSLVRRNGFDSLHAFSGAPDIQCQPSSQPQSNYSSFWMNDPVWNPNGYHDAQDGFSSVSPPSGVQSAQQQEVKSFGQSYHLFRDQPFQNPLQKFVNSNNP
uniref:C3H1-type domain-containing protein n=1 Tax=Ditylenchus dipsaci TaxID=166011 RepID=A0A915DJM1_9BILA